jgi:hypothetical protein
MITGDARFLIRRALARAGEFLLFAGLAPAIELVADASVSPITGR